MSPEINPYESPQVEEPLPLATDSDEPATPFRPAHGWGTLTAVALAGSTLLAVGGLVFCVLLLRLYGDEAAYYAGDPEWESDLFDALNVIFVVLMLLRLVTAGMLLTWMYQAHRNLPALGHQELDSKPVWTVVCWFVPVMNLFCPYQVMHEIWWRSDPESDAHGGGRPSALLVQCWWGAWLTVLAMAVWGNFLDSNIETVQDAAMATRADIVHLAALVVAALMLMRIIVVTNRRQMQRHLRMQLP